LFLNKTPKDQSLEMDYLGVWVGSYVAKKIDDFLNFLMKVEQCTTFEGEISISIWNWRKKGYAAPIVLFIFGQFRQLQKNVKYKILNFLFHRIHPYL
jgi:hypothetical protein